MECSLLSVSVLKSYSYCSCEVSWAWYPSLSRKVLFWELRRSMRRAIIFGRMKTLKHIETIESNMMPDMFGCHYCSVWVGQDWQDCEQVSPERDEQVAGRHKADVIWWNLSRNLSWAKLLQGVNSRYPDGRNDGRNDGQNDGWWVDELMMLHVSDCFRTCQRRLGEHPLEGCETQIRKSEKESDQFEQRIVLYEVWFS